jgi:hypothetical protein
LNLDTVDSGDASQLRCDLLVSGRDAEGEGFVHLTFLQDRLQPGSFLRAPAVALQLDAGDETSNADSGNDD